MQPISNSTDTLYGHDGFDALQIARWFIVSNSRVKRRAMKLGGVDEVANEAILRLIQNKNGLNKYALSTCICKNVLWAIADMSKKKRQCDAVVDCQHIARDLHIDAVQEQEAESAEQLEVLNDAINLLGDERKAKVLQLRFDGNTYREIAGILKISTERARQVELKAIRDLRCSDRLKALEGDFQVE